MNSGRIPLKTPEIIDAEATLDQPAFANGMAVMRQVVPEEQQEAIDGVFALGRLVGAAQMANSISVISATAEVRAFEEVKKSKSFKHLKINIDGEFRPAENIDEFCRVVFGGRGYKAMSNQKVMLDRLGEDLYESVNQLGLKRAQLRLLINLPEDTRAVVEEAMRAGSKSEIETLIQSLANQLDESVVKQEELRAEIAAKEDRIAIKSRQLDEAEEKLVRIKRMPPDEVLIELRQHAVKSFGLAKACIMTELRSVVLAIINHHESNGGNSDEFLAGLAGDVQKELTILRDELGINDITPAMLPEYLTDPRFNDFAPDAAAPLKN